MFVDLKHILAYEQKKRELTWPMFLSDQTSLVKNLNVLLCRHKYFAGKYTTCKIHMKPHSDSRGVFSVSSLVKILITSDIVFDP